MMFPAMRAVLSAARSGAARRAGSSSRFLSGSSDSRRLAGKVAVITGAASGIGKATAAEFVRNGARVVLADVQDELGRAAAADLGGTDTACYTRCDVTDEAQVAAAVDLAVARHGRLDIMFNNAGITGGSYAAAPIESLDMADFDRVMAVNLRGVAAGIKHAARAMAPRGQGCILCTSSTAGALAGSGPHAYSVSKTAVVGMVRSAAAELAARGVRVNAISPYAIATSMGARAVREMLGLPPRNAGDEEEEELVRRVFEEDFNEMGGGVVLRAEDVARAAVFLASDDARYITGHNLMVDGGFSVAKPLNVPAN
ncbi:momilactone A synthase [Aegilops tauschii subsp. strangulata]|nr:momilactone A synthase [Aegilops tauschii subsp. strangulata]